MSSKSVSDPIPTPQSPESIDLSTTKRHGSRKAAVLHNQNEEYSGLADALELGQSSMDAAVCLSCCALDIYRSTFCFAPQLSGYFELGSRLLAAYAELQSSYFGLLKPHAEALSSPDWAAQSCVPAEMLEQSMDIALGALSAQMSFLKEVTEASVSFDVLRGSYGDVQPQQHA